MTETAIITAAPGFPVLISPEDLPQVLSYSWYLLAGKWTCYARCDRVGLLHRFLASPPCEKVVDHIDHDGLNNTRSNLQVVTRSLNDRNRRKQYCCPFPGVFRFQTHWFYYQGAVPHGGFKTLLSAAIDRDRWLCAMGLSHQCTFSSFRTPLVTPPTGKYDLIPESLDARVSS